MKIHNKLPKLWRETGTYRGRFDSRDDSEREGNGDDRLRREAVMAEGNRRLAEPVEVGSWPRLGTCRNTGREGRW